MAEREKRMQKRVQLSFNDKSAEQLAVYNFLKSIPNKSDFVTKIIGKYLRFDWNTPKMNVSDMTDVSSNLGENTSYISVDTNKTNTFSGPKLENLQTSSTPELEAVKKYEPKHFKEDVTSSNLEAENEKKNMSLGLAMETLSAFFDPTSNQEG